VVRLSSPGAIPARVQRPRGDPRGPQLQAKALRGRRGVFRLRSGEWRVLYELDHRRRRVRVLEVGPGHDVYD
jgi:mRNA-degrading endonuclease RelE of RelBE toxin-antitoxin system